MILWVIATVTMSFDYSPSKSFKFHQGVYAPARFVRLMFQSHIFAYILIILMQLNNLNFSLLSTISVFLVFR